ncbi:hypothetical protein EVAR_105_1 [Eumeta japonica]|uniref:Uncharacterized protein n=1 Tax=Eumeta variegata TaxID=151549 RepID=A0A4C1S8B2_EUMVA|nr:hypothetical protein EVAR_105_1 [Eumeta japonica]
MPPPSLLRRKIIIKNKKKHHHHHKKDDSVASEEGEVRNVEVVATQGNGDISHGTLGVPGRILTTEFRLRAPYSVPRGAPSVVGFTLCFPIDDDGRQ